MVNFMDTFNYGEVQSEFHKLLNSVDTQLKYNLPNEVKEIIGGSEAIQLYFKNAKTLYTTIIFICSDSDNCCKKSPYYSLTTPQLNRTLLEILFSFVYLLADFPTHSKMFYQAVLREKEEKIQADKRNYSDQTEWQEYFRKQEAELAKLKEQFKVFDLTTEEKTKLGDIANNSNHFPKVGNIVKRLNQTDSVVKFLKYIQDLVYRELSSKTHLEPSGLIDLSIFYLNPNPFIYPNSFKSLEEELRDFKTKQVWISIGLIMCICSEIELNFEFKLKIELIKLWEKFIEGGNDFIKEVYEKRYKDLLVS
jgi:Family of unknown function (DUF5677)